MLPVIRPHSGMRNLQSPIRTALAVLVVFVTAGAWTQTTAVVHRLDGRAEPIQFESAQFEAPDKGVLRGRAAGRSVEFPSGEIWQIEFGVEPVPRGSTEHLWLNDGSRLSGQLVRWVASQRAVVWTDLFRTIELFDDAILGLTHGSPPPSRLPDAVAGSDALYTADGDRMTGRLLRIEEGDVAFRSELGNITCPRQKVNALVLKPKSDVQTPQSAFRIPHSEASWVLEFANGDRVWARSWAIESGRLRCAVGGGTPTAPSTLLRRAILLGPRVEAFSKIEPQYFAMRPVLAGTKAILVDRGPENCPLRLAERDYLFGLFLRPEAEMDYALSDDAQWLLADVGMSSELSPNLGTARVAFAVGDAAWKTYDLRHDAPPVAVAIDLRASKRLRIRVERADPWAIGAQVIFGEPVLVNKPK